MPTDGWLGKVTSPAQAAALVFASNPLFASISQPVAGVVGHSTSYQASQNGSGYAVSVSIGSGDCPAGCINQHTWNYVVSASGDVAFVDETGDQIGIQPDQGTSDPANVTIHLVAGPTCPVEQIPPNPACAPKPVVDAAVALLDPTGQQVALLKSDDTGTITTSVPGGAYYLEAAGAGGLMRVPEAQAFSVPGGGSVVLTMEYDTGIR